MLVLGILSFFCFGIILGPIAAIMGKNTLNEIDANPQAYTNRSPGLADDLRDHRVRPERSSGFIIVAAGRRRRRVDGLASAAPRPRAAATPRRSTTGPRRRRRTVPGHRMVPTSGVRTASGAKAPPYP